MSKLYVDGLNIFLKHACISENSYRYTMSLRLSVEIFISAALKRFRDKQNIIVFIDAYKSERYIQDELIRRQEDRLTNESHTYVGISVASVLGDILTCLDIPVIYNYELDLDDTLAAWANIDRAVVLSGDKDFMCYQNRNFIIAQHYTIENGNLCMSNYVSPSRNSLPESTPYKERIPLTIPDKKPDVKYSNYPCMLSVIKEDRYFKGISGPSKMIKQYGNPNAYLKNLRAEVYYILGKRTPIKEKIINWKDNQAYWIEQDNTPHYPCYLNSIFTNKRITGSYYKYIHKIARKIYPKLIYIRSRAYVVSFYCAIAELISIFIDAKVYDIISNIEEEYK